MYLFRGRRRRQAPLPAVILIAILSAAVFAGGFLLFYSIGSRLAGGQGLFGKHSSAVAATSESTTGALHYAFAGGPDLRAFRDLAYVPVKGIYVTSWAAGSAKWVPELLELTDRTEINAWVIDVKDYTGFVTYAADVPLAAELGLLDDRIPDLDGLLDTLTEHKIIPIARIVCFKDPVLAEKRKDLAVLDKDGGLWRDKKDSAYTNPYNHEVWDYIVDVAKDAADRGFREIQFDYVRFPSDGNISDCVYPGKSGPREDAIAAFLAYARERLEKQGVWFSADVFGLTLHVKDDLGIGQKIEKVATNVDIVCPMVYPSHYEAGDYNIADPNGSPYEIVSCATADAGRRLDGTGVLYRPWLQDFFSYGVAEVEAQIQAVEEQGYSEWILWDPSLEYTEEALRVE